MAVQATPFRQRKKVKLVIAFAIFASIALFIVTRSFVVTPLVQNILRSTFGEQIVVSEAHINWSGGISVKNVILRVKGIEGEAADVVTITSASISFKNLISFQKTEIDSLDIEKVIVRLAESSEDPGIHNVSTFFSGFMHDNSKVNDVKTSDESKPQIPSIELKELVIETGLMGQGTWSTIGSRAFTVSHVQNNSKILDFQLVDVESDLKIQVGFEPDTSTLHVGTDYIPLNTSMFELLPFAARVWCEEAKMQGGVKHLLAMWSPSEGIKIEGAVEDIHFLLQKDYGLPWVHYKSGKITEADDAASLDVATGQLMFDGSSITLQDLQGALHPPHKENDVPVSFSAEIVITDLPSSTLGEDGWFTSLLTKSTFTGSVQIEEFQSLQQIEEEVVLPYAAAQVLKIFQMEQWSVNARFEIAREASGGGVHINGDLLIDAALGRFEGFPYPLHNIKSHIKFLQDEIQVVFLQAHGSGDSPVHMSGFVKAAGDYFVVDLNLHVDHAPLDETLHDAISEPVANVMDGLFSKAALEKVIQALPNSQWQSFELGGKIGLDLKLKHDSRSGPNLNIEGEISLENVGIILDVFPYPVTLQEGTVLLSPSGLRVPEGEYIRFKGQGDGFGEIRGSILFQEHGLAIPDLVLSLENEKVTPAIIEAISVSAGDSYEIALGVLGGLGLETRMNVEGRIQGGGDSKIDTKFIVQIDKGFARPNKQLAKAIHASDEFWPEGFLLTGVSAEIGIINGAVTMNAASCECETGAIDATMSIDKGEFDLVLHGVDLPLSSRFVQVLPSTASSRLVDAWTWLKPSGLMDAEIRMRSRDGESSLYMEIMPVLVTASGNGQTVEMDLKRGLVIVDNTNVYLSNLDFELKEDGEPQGNLQIRGEVYAESSDYQFDIGASWSDASISSPLTRAIVGMVGDQAGVDYYDSLQPIGYASATLVTSGDSESITYDIRVAPSLLSATFDGRRADAMFDQGVDVSDNVIHFNNNGVSFERLYGKLGDGHFSLEGSIGNVSGIHGSFDLTWDGPSGDPSLIAVLPSTVADKLEAIKLTGGTSVLPNGEIRFVGDNWNALDISFKGNISLDEVSVTVGIPLKKIVGEIKIAGFYDEEHLSDLQFSFDVDEMEALGRTVSYVDGKLLLNTDKQRLIFEKLRGESSTGGVSIAGWIAVDKSKEYTVEILVAGVELETDKNEGALATMQGELNGWLSIAGDIHGRRGVGVLRVLEGNLAVDPLSMTAMQVLQLALPSASSISGANIEMYIDDERMILDQITFTCSDSSATDLVFEGEGTIDTETYRLQARLHPRAGLPILRDITGAIFDQLYSIDVTGELLDPTVSVVFFPFITR